MKYSTLKNCVSKALHLFFNEYVADIQLPGKAFNSSPYHRVLNRVLAWLGVNDFCHLM
jgi:hypothetical protein